MNIYINNLAADVADADLFRAFSAYGRVLCAKVVCDLQTGKSKGFGFVEMARREAQGAIASLNGSVLNGRNIAVTEAPARSGARVSPQL